MDGFIEAGKVSELDQGKMKTVGAGKAVVLVNAGGELYAIDNECPHAGCDLVDGTVEGESVVCECHGSQFNVKTGAVERGPATEAVRTYPVRVEGDDVFVGAGS